MKREQKSLTNKGFSLVELIIVVAIMAVLIGVLAPQYLRYVEKTRLQRDNTAIADFANVVKIACTEEGVNTAIPAAGATFKFTAPAAPATGDPTLSASGVTALDDEIDLTVHLTDVKLSSNTYTGGAALPQIKVEIDTNGIVTVKCDGWIDAPGGTALTGSNAKTF